MSNMDSQPIAIVGAGLGGLAAACTLAARGHRVQVFEKSEWLGGKAAVLAEEGFRFDMGPTILTLPSVLRRIFAEAGSNLDDEMELVRLDPQWRSFFTGGETLDLLEQTEAMGKTLSAFSPKTGVAEGYRRWMELSARQHDLSKRWYFYRSIGGLKDMFNWQNSFQAGSLRDLFSLRMGATVSGTIRAHVPDARVAQMLDHFTQYVGSAPDQSPAILCGIAHMQTDEGVWYPKGGTGSIPRALAHLAERLGVQVCTGENVVRILVRDGRATGIETENGETIRCAAVISNSDTVRTHRELLPEKTARAFARRRRYEPACSGVVLYLGLDRAYPHLLHHNFVFSADPHAEFESIYRRGEPAPDPTCYVCAPARTEPDVAPPGGEALYILVHTPYLRPHHDWARILPEYREVILRKLAATAGLEDLERRIIFERILTPTDIEQRYRVPQGAIYGLASHGRFFGAFKPANRSPDIRGLYFAGGSAHPGPGMPMALMSGWIAADCADKDFAGGPRCDPIPAGNKEHKVEATAAA